MKKQIGFKGLFLSLFLFPLIFVLTDSPYTNTDVLGNEALEEEICYQTVSDEQILSQVNKMDLVSFFKTPEVGIMAGDTEATLTGALLEIGTPITVTDSFSSLTLPPE